MSQRGVIQCSACGGSSPAESERCDYCGNFLLRLTKFETLKAGSSPQLDDGVTFFRSLGPLYKLSALAGLVMMIALYVFMFDSVSETELVNLSPIWFLLLVFGTCGMHAEKAVHLVLSKKAQTFGEALSATTKSLPPFLIIVVYLVFSLPSFFLGLKRWVSSPLLLATTTTLLWGFALYFFLFAIFPSL
jgi:hypothetical protein